MGARFRASVKSRNLGARGLMKVSAQFVASICLHLGAAPFLCAQKTPAVDVAGPTIVAFFPPVSNAELIRSADTNEALSDFQYYDGQVWEPLKKHGIAIHQIYAHQFMIRSGKSTTTFTPQKVGYYLVAPGKKPRIEYGVTTDEGL